MTAAELGRTAALCAALAAFPAAAPAAAAECGALTALVDAFPKVREAYAVLDRAARDGPAGESAAARALVADFDRLLAARECYIDRVAEARAAAAAGSGPEDLLPTLRRQRDTLQIFLDGLPDDAPGARDAVAATVQSLNLGIDARADALASPAPDPEAIAQLLLHAETMARIALAHVEVARDRLRVEVLGASASGEAMAALEALRDFVPRALEFNAGVVGDPRLSRRLLAGGAGVVMARGEYALDGAPFDRARHCRLARFRAAEALDALAARLGVVAKEREAGVCERRGGAVVAWLSAPEEDLIRVRAGDWRR